ncbi:uncharacterized protein LOC120337781 [Styela clava]
MSRYLLSCIGRRQTIYLRNIRCFATKEQTSANVPTKNEKPPHEPSNPRLNKTVNLSDLNKFFLRMSGRWKFGKEIPDSLPQDKYNSDMWVVRIRVASAMMVMWLLLCLGIASWGRKHINDSHHRIVMQQYLEQLSDKERKEFLEKYDVKMASRNGR